MTNSDPGADGRRVAPCKDCGKHHANRLACEFVTGWTCASCGWHEYKPGTECQRCGAPAPDGIYDEPVDVRRVAPLDPRLEWQPIETLPIVGYFSSGGPERFSSLPDPPGEAQRIPAPPDAPQE